MKRFLCALFLFIFLLVTSCGHACPELDAALEAAGDNRAELEKVLRHYEDDTLKFTV